MFFYLVHHGVPVGVPKQKLNKKNAKGKTSMNIEIVEFYPFERDDGKEILSGTLRVNLLDIGVHIMGIFVSKRKNFWYFRLPGAKGTNYETGEAVRYPFFVFEDREKQNMLLEAIRVQGRVFIEKRLADTENPLKFPPKQQPAPKQAEPAKVADVAPAPKETAAIAKPKQRVWVDPPKRQEMPRDILRKR